ncbi:Spermatogenesis-associated protein 31E1 [Camelus dromedarius]|uniref:Spermatogenesis-associated protein 31E1 n=1 Tax=Camelus dromedarius TaxID=9838 RepID=A0A5N4CP68_CAMDR|nr:Spermatogenesis-associated protein 31E1 [Camelus dromedarius]
MGDLELSAPGSRVSEQALARCQASGRLGTSKESIVVTSGEATVMPEKQLLQSTSTGHICPRAQGRGGPWCSVCNSFVLSLCLALDNRQQAAHLCAASTTLQSTSRHLGPYFCSYSSGKPLTTRLWRQGGACIPGSQALPRQQTKRRPSLSLKEAYLLVQELRPEGEASRNGGHWTPYRHSPSASRQLASISRKQAHTLSWGLEFCGCCWEDTSSSEELVASRACADSPTGLDTSAFFKCCCLGVRCLSSLSVEGSVGWLRRTDERSCRAGWLGCGPAPSPAQEPFVTRPQLCTFRVPDIILGALCGLGLFFLITSCFQVGPPAPPPRKHGSFRKPGWAGAGLGARISSQRAQASRPGRVEGSRASPKCSDQWPRTGYREPLSPGSPAVNRCLGQDFPRAEAPRASDWGCRGALASGSRPYMTEPVAPAGLGVCASEQRNSDRNPGWVSRQKSFILTPAGRGQSESWAPAPCSPLSLSIHRRAGQESERKMSFGSSSVQPQCRDSPVSKDEDAVAEFVPQKQNPQDTFQIPCSTKLEGLGKGVGGGVRGLQGTSGAWAGRWTSSVTVLFNLLRFLVRRLSGPRGEWMWKRFVNDKPFVSFLHHCQDQGSLGCWSWAPASQPLGSHLDSMTQSPVFQLLQCLQLGADLVGEPWDGGWLKPWGQRQDWAANAHPYLAAQPLCLLFLQPPGRFLDKGGFQHLYGQEPPDKVCKAEPAGAQQPFHSFGTYPQFLSVIGAFPFPGQPFVRPLAPSPSPPSPPDARACSPPLTAPSAPLPPDSTPRPQRDPLALPRGTIPRSSSPRITWAPAISGLDGSSCPIPELPWWQVASKAWRLSTLTCSESQQGCLSCHPPEAPFWEDPTSRQVKASGLPFVTPDVQKLLEILITKRAGLKVQKEKGKEQGPGYHLDSSVNTFKFLDPRHRQHFWSIKGQPAGLLGSEKSPYLHTRGDQLQQTCSQPFWGLPFLHSESLVAPPLPYPPAQAQPQPLTPTRPQCQPPPLAQVETQARPHLLTPTRPDFQPPPPAQFEMAHCTPSFPILPPSSQPQARYCDVACPAPSPSLPSPRQQGLQGPQHRLRPSWGFHQPWGSEEIGATPPAKVHATTEQTALQKPSVSETDGASGHIPRALPGTGTMGPSKPSAFIGQGSWDAQKMGSRCPARAPPGKGLSIVEVTCESGDHAKPQLTEVLEKPPQPQPEESVRTAESASTLLRGLGGSPPGDVREPPEASLIGQGDKSPSQASVMGAEKGSLQQPSPSPSVARDEPREETGGRASSDSCSSVTVVDLDAWPRSSKFTKPEQQHMRVLLQDYETGVLLQDCATSTLLQDCHSDMSLAADFLAAEASLSHSQTLSTPVEGAVGDRRSPGDSRPHQRARGRKNDRRPRPGQHKKGLAERKAHLARGLSHPSRKKESADSQRSEARQLRKGQAPSEISFRKYMKLLLQWVFPSKDKGPKDPLQKGKPASATAQSPDPAQSRSFTDSTVANVEALMTAVGQILEEKLALHPGHGPYASELNWHEGDPQAPVGQHYCYQRVVSYQEHRRVMSGKPCDPRAPPKGHSCHGRNRWASRSHRDGKWACLPGEPGPPGRRCQHGLGTAGLPGHPAHCPRHCLLRNHASPALSGYAPYVLPGRATLLQGTTYTKCPGTWLPEGTTGPWREADPSVEFSPLPQFPHCSLNLTPPQALYLELVQLKGRGLQRLKFPSTSSRGRLRKGVRGSTGPASRAGRNLAPQPPPRLAGKSWVEVGRERPLPLPFSGSGAAVSMGNVAPPALGVCSGCPETSEGLSRLPQRRDQPCPQRPPPLPGCDSVQSPHRLMVGHWAPGGGVWRGRRQVAQGACKCYSDQGAPGIPPPSTGPEGRRWGWGAHPRVSTLLQLPEPRQRAATCSFYSEGQAHRGSKASSRKVLFSTEDRLAVCSLYLHTGPKEAPRGQTGLKRAGDCPGILASLTWLSALLTPEPRQAEVTCGDWGAVHLSSPARPHGKLGDGEHPAPGGAPHPGDSRDGLASTPVKNPTHGTKTQRGGGRRHRTVVSPWSQVLPRAPSCRVGAGPANRGPSGAQGRVAQSGDPEPGCHCILSGLMTGESHMEGDTVRTARSRNGQVPLPLSCVKCSKASNGGRPLGRPTRRHPSQRALTEHPTETLLRDPAHRPHRQALGSESPPIVSLPGAASPPQVLPDTQTLSVLSQMVVSAWRTVLPTPYALFQCRASPLMGMLLCGADGEHVNFVCTWRCSLFFPALVHGALLLPRLLILTSGRWEGRKNKTARKARVTCPALLQTHYGAARTWQGFPGGFLFLVAGGGAPSLVGPHSAPSLGSPHAAAIPSPVMAGLSSWATLEQRGTPSALRLGEHVLLAFQPALTPCLQDGPTVMPCSPGFRHFTLRTCLRPQSWFLGTPCWGCTHRTLKTLSKNPSPCTPPWAFPTFLEGGCAAVMGGASSIGPSFPGAAGVAAGLVFSSGNPQLLGFWQSPAPLISGNSFCAENTALASSDNPAGQGNPRIEAGPLHRPSHRDALTQGSRVQQSQGHPIGSTPETTDTSRQACCLGGPWARAPEVQAGPRSGTQPSPGSFLRVLGSAPPALASDSSLGHIPLAPQEEHNPAAAGNPGPGAIPPALPGDPEPAPAGHPELACTCRKQRASNITQALQGYQILHVGKTQNRGQFHQPCRKMLNQLLQETQSQVTFHEQCRETQKLHLQETQDWDQFQQHCRETLSQTPNLFLQKTQDWVPFHQLCRDKLPAPSHFTSPEGRPQSCTCKGPRTGTNLTSPVGTPQACFCKRIRDWSYFNSLAGRIRACYCRRHRAGGNCKTLQGDPEPTAAGEPGWGLIPLGLQGGSGTGRKAPSCWDAPSLAGRSAGTEAGLPRFGGDRKLTHRVPVIPDPRRELTGMGEDWLLETGQEPGQRDGAHCTEAASGGWRAVDAAQLCHSCFLFGSIVGVISLEEKCSLVIANPAAQREVEFALSGPFVDLHYWDLQAVIQVFTTGWCLVPYVEAGQGSQLTFLKNAGEKQEAGAGSGEGAMGVGSRQAPSQVPLPPHITSLVQPGSGEQVEDGARTGQRARIGKESKSKGGRGRVGGRSLYGDRRPCRHQAFSPRLRAPAPRGSTDECELGANRFKSQHARPAKGKKERKALFLGEDEAPRDGGGARRGRVTREASVLRTVTGDRSEQASWVEDGGAGRRAVAALFTISGSGDLPETLHRLGLLSPAPSVEACAPTHVPGAAVAAARRPRCAGRLGSHDGWLEPAPGEAFRRSPCLPRAPRQVAERPLGVGAGQACWKGGGPAGAANGSGGQRKDHLEAASATFALGTLPFPLTPRLGLPAAWKLFGEGKSTEQPGTSGCSPSAALIPEQSQHWHSLGVGLGTGPGLPDLFPHLVSWEPHLTPRQDRKLRTSFLSLHHHSVGGHHSPDDERRRLRDGQRGRTPSHQSRWDSTPPPAPPHHPSPSPAPPLTDSDRPPSGWGVGCRGRWVPRLPQAAWSLCLTRDRGDPGILGSHRMNTSASGPVTRTRTEPCSADTSSAMTRLWWLTEVSGNWWVLVDPSWDAKCPYSPTPVISGGTSRVHVSEGCSELVLGRGRLGTCQARAQHGRIEYHQCHQQREARALNSRVSTLAGRGRVFSSDFLSTLHRPHVPAGGARIRAADWSASFLGGGVCFPQTERPAPLGGSGMEVAGRRVRGRRGSPPYSEVMPASRGGACFLPGWGPGLGGGNGVAPRTRFDCGGGSVRVHRPGGVRALVSPPGSPPPRVIGGVYTAGHLRGPGVTFCRCVFGFPRWRTRGRGAAVAALFTISGSGDLPETLHRLGSSARAPLRGGLRPHSRTRRRSGCGADLGAPGGLGSHDGWLEPAPGEASPPQPLPPAAPLRGGCRPTLLERGGAGGGSQPAPPLTYPAPQWLRRRPRCARAAWGAMTGGWNPLPERLLRRSPCLPRAPRQVAERPLGVGAGQALLERGRGRRGQPFVDCHSGFLPGVPRGFCLRVSALVSEGLCVHLSVSPVWGMAIERTTLEAASATFALGTLPFPLTRTGLDSLLHGSYLEKKKSSIRTTLTPDPGPGTSAARPSACSDSRAVPALALTGCGTWDCGLASLSLFPHLVSVGTPLNPQVLLRQDRKLRTLLPFTSPPLREAGTIPRTRRRRLRDGQRGAQRPTEERPHPLLSQSRWDSTPPPAPPHHPSPSPAPPLTESLSSGLLSSDQAPVRVGLWMSSSPPAPGRLESLLTRDRGDPGILGSHRMNTSASGPSSPYVHLGPCSADTSSAMTQALVAHEKCLGTGGCLVDPSWDAKCPVLSNPVSQRWHLQGHVSEGCSELVLGRGRLRHVPGKSADMAGSEYHQCHQQRGQGIEIPELVPWLGGGGCSPVSSEHPAPPPFSIAWAVRRMRSPRQTWSASFLGGGVCFPQDGAAGSLAAPGWRSRGRRVRGRRRLPALCLSLLLAGVCVDLTELGPRAGREGTGALADPLRLWRSECPCPSGPGVFAALVLTARVCTPQVTCGDAGVT